LSTTIKEALTELFAKNKIEAPKGNIHLYQSWHNRLLPFYVCHMRMATCDNGLAAMHYGPSKVSALVADQTPCPSSQLRLETSSARVDSCGL